MDQVLQTWRALDLRRRIMVIGAGALTLAAVLLLAQMASRPGMALLYSGLDSATAGEVVGELEQMKVPSEIRGDAIYVPADARDRVRLTLARKGLPRQGQAGYELLDEISGFSATSDMFDAAYWRAKEGELARSILSSTGVRAARVHIAVPSRRPFASEGAGPTASVTVTMSGGSLTRKQATAMRYLVALAVPDLGPDKVAVIDSRAGIVLAPGEEGTAEDASAAAAELAGRLDAELVQMLSARVGRDKVRVSVSVEADRESERVLETVIEPDSRVTLSADTEEITSNSSGTAGAVTVASNLPTGDAENDPDNKSSRTETRERVNYDYSQVRRERERAAGAIRQISVAVLVDGIVEPGANGEPEWQPRPEGELETLRELVRAAVGFDADRGDVVTVESMRFQPDATPGALVESKPWMQFLERNALALIQFGVLAAVAVVLALTVVRPVLAGRTVDPDSMITVSGSGEAVAREGEGDPALPGPAASTSPDTERPTPEALRQTVSEKQEETLAMLKDWLSTPAETEERA